VKPKQQRAFTASRIVALTVIGLLVLGLGYLRFSPDASVTVPQGAKAGDLHLHPCHYDTEAGSYAADCGTLIVPENRADPSSRLIAIEITRIKARSANPTDPVFRLVGGPGLSNMTFPMASRYAEHRDVVLLGYRGIDSSTVLQCPEVTSALQHSSDWLTEKSYRAYGDGFRECADRLTQDGVDLDGYTVVSQVDDLEAARKAFGYRKIDLLSESAGTRTALIYGWRYPQSVHRSVMVGVNPPGHFIWYGEDISELEQRYARYCEQDPSCSKRTDDLVASLDRTSRDMPGRFLFLPVNKSTVRLASYFGLHETTPENAPLNGPMTLGSWLSAAKGDASGLWLQSFAGNLLFPKSFVWGQYASFGRADDKAARRYFAAGGHDVTSNFGDAGTAFVWGGGAMADSWPEGPDQSAYNRMRPTNVETLLVSGELDFSTPPQGATAMLPNLSNGHQVILRGFGHSGSFFTQQPEAGTHLVNTYFDTGKVDRSQYKPERVDFTPDVTQTALGKGFAGGMIGLALLTLLSLALMARRVHRKGGFGRKAGAVLRSAYTVVLGLGGWLLGVVVVISTTRGVPVDGELFSALTVGAPIGLGVYLAWVRRDWASRVKAVGFAAALGGALVGGWLGFNVTSDMLALITTIAGAAVGSNLALILLDIAWDRQGRDRSAVAAPAEPLEVRPSVG
jgi:pimeloyl-ACP methyl ester carboxylesterase